jgi:hypothetical protein
MEQAYSSDDVCLPLGHDIMRLKNALDRPDSHPDGRAEV